MTLPMTNGLAVCSYTGWRPEHGIAIRSSVGHPRFWRGPRLEVSKWAMPTGIFGTVDKTDERYSALYRARLDRHAGDLAVELAGIAKRHPGERLVLCCFEDVHAGRYCHRTDLRAWLEDHTGLDVPELSEPADQGALFV